MDKKNVKNKRRFSLPFILTLCFLFSLVFVSIFGSSGIVKVSQMNKKLNRLKKDMQFLEKENNRVRKEIHRLKTDSYYIEKIAREELGLVKPGERVYEFVDEKEEKSQTDQ